MTTIQFRITDVFTCEVPPGSDPEVVRSMMLNTLDLFRETHDVDELSLEIIKE